MKTGSETTKWREFKYSLPSFGLWRWLWASDESLLGIWGQVFHKSDGRLGKRCNILDPRGLNTALLRLLILTSYGCSCPLRRKCDHELKLAVMSVKEPCTPPAVLCFSLCYQTKKAVQSSTSEISLGRLWLAKCV